ncbi:Protein FAM91A1 [Coccomyxa sp. Obi]|nr:Protein FAM91A1 [Coccomyxa sp. Obi]
MATEEWIKRAIQNGKLYEDLPPRVRSVLPVSEWKLKVKEHCIQRGLSYDDSLANTSCQEQEYYEDLLRYYRYNYRLFPYHLSDYVCRVLRVTPFRYYCDLLFTVMREEKSYDQIPNFTAADIVRHVGIGRNEYIATMNKCKAKKLLWRMNKAVVKEHLPTEPQDVVKQPWWIAHVVNLGEVEFRSLAPTELAACTEAARPGGVRLRDADMALIDQLHRRGLIYLEVPIRPDDHVSIPPLEGFVSNRDSERNEDKADPIEIILYAVFVATSARASVAELADILQVELPKLQAAISIACRLGFATRLPNPAEDEEYLNIPNMSLDFDLDSEQLDLTPTAMRASSLGYGIASLAAEEIDDGHSGQGIALVVDAEVTSYLMMGALSPGLKRHSVTLFEGGRVTGAEVISELIFELDASVEAASGFEGEMQRLAGYARALATSLRCIRASGGARPIELLRKESLAGLAPAAAARVLSHAYVAVVPIAPLPYPPLPLAPNRPGPTNFGPTAEAATPWVQLALYTAMRSGPVSVVFVCGQRLWRLPPQLLQCTHALLWPWNMDAVRAHVVPVCWSPFLLFMQDMQNRECKNPTASNMSWIFMYADDIALVAETQEALQEALAIIDRVFIQWGMHINIRKTQILCLQSGTQTGDSSEQFWLRGQPLEQVQMFKYLGSICSADMSMQPEIASRLSRAGGAYHKLSRLKVWKDKNISVKIKVILYKVIVQSTLLYGCETWAVTNEDIRKLEVFQMRCLRRILGISLLERIPNAVTRAQCDIPEVANLIRYRRLRYLGHVARMGDTRLPLQFMFGTISGTGTRGRPMKSWNDYVRDDLEAIGLPYNWRRKCKNRDEWRAAIKVLLDVPSP